MDGTEHIRELIDRFEEDIISLETIIANAQKKKDQAIINIDALKKTLALIQNNGESELDEINTNPTLKHRVFEILKSTGWTTTNVIVQHLRSYYTDGRSDKSIKQVLAPLMSSLKKKGELITREGAEGALGYEWNIPE